MRIYFNSTRVKKVTYCKNRFKRLIRVPLLGITSLLSQLLPNLSQRLHQICACIFSTTSVLLWKPKAGWQWSHLFHFLPQTKSPGDTCAWLWSFPSQTLRKERTFYYVPRCKISQIYGNHDQEQYNHFIRTLNFGNLLWNNFSATKSYSKVSTTSPQSQ